MISTVAASTRVEAATVLAGLEAAVPAGIQLNQGLTLRSRLWQPHSFDLRTQTTVSKPVGVTCIASARRAAGLLTSRVRKCMRTRPSFKTSIVRAHELIAPAQTKGSQAIKGLKQAFDRSLRMLAAQRDHRRPSEI